jgi:hypothetical protein
MRRDVYHTLKLAWCQEAGAPILLFEERDRANRIVAPQAAFQLEEAFASHMPMCLGHGSSQLSMNGCGGDSRGAWWYTCDKPRSASSPLA